MIKEEILSCNKCFLRRECDSPIPYHGSEYPKALVVESKPEILLNEKGKEAQYLRSEILPTFKLFKNEIRITSVLRCPTDNFNSMSVGYCIEFLQKELSTINAEMIFVLGADAWHSLSSNKMHHKNIVNNTFWINKFNCVMVVLPDIQYMINRQKEYIDILSELATEVNQLRNEHVS